MTCATDLNPDYAKGLCQLVKGYLCDSDLYNKVRGSASKAFHALEKAWKELQHLTGYFKDKYWDRLKPGVVVDNPLACTAIVTHQLQTLDQRLKEGIASCLPDDGLGGSYIFENLAIFKPMDEEVFAPANPKGRPGEIGQARVRTGVRAGSSVNAECAAYRLDRDNFAGVPPTVKVKLTHPWLFDPKEGYRHHFRRLKSKEGSLQLFVENEGSVERAQLARPEILDEIPVHEVHKIGILDIRLMNQDRHLGNILMQKAGDSWRLIPIDHGMCLPEDVREARFFWSTLAQADEPFDEETLAYIRKLDPEDDARILRKEFGITEERRLQIMKWGTTFLKKGAEKEWTLKQLADFLTFQSAEAVYGNEQLESLACYLLDPRNSEEVDIESFAMELLDMGELQEVLNRVNLESPSQIAQRLGQLKVKSKIQWLLEKAEYRDEAVLALFD